MPTPTSISNAQPTYKRQRFLLAFMRQIDGSVSATDLQKLVFLHTMHEASDFYEFLPYRFGAYSFQLNEDVEILCKSGFLAANGSKVKPAGSYLRETKYNIEDERGDNLIRKAYRAHPFYTINSEIVARLFPHEERVLYNEERKKYKQSDTTLFNIGYEGKSIEAFTNILLTNGVSLLCDVRKNPLSRKFGFSKKKLTHIMDTVGIKYVHIPDLGIATDKRTLLATPEDYKLLFAGYAKTLPGLAPYLNKTNDLLKEQKRIALMCYEQDAAMCHRHVVRDYLMKNYGVRSADL